MACDPCAVRRYLSPPTRTFWRWEGNGQVLAWVDGTTIAFREEVERVLARLAPGGLPPFGSVALLLAACRNSWRDLAPRTIDAYLGLFEDPPAWTLEVRLGLDRVNDLVPELRGSPGAKASLAEVVFERSTMRGLPEDAAGVLDGFISGAWLALAPEREGPHGPRTSALEVLRQDLSALRQGLAALDPEALELRMKTGLETPVRPADLDLTPVERARALLSGLAGDPELGGVARVARDMLAAVHVPRPLSDVDEMPVGGVSDIANRGPLERLLASELAHDDLTLSVRIALGEALYLRRERPQASPPRRRVVLVDTGIRLWGVPRVFAAAVALAFVAAAHRKAEVAAFRTRAGRLVSCDLTSREGLVEHLESIEAAPQPGASLPSFLEQVGPDADAIVVTHEDVLADPSFRDAVREAGVPLLYAATVTRKGHYVLRALTARGERVLGTAELDLARLLTDPKPGRPAPVPLADDRALPFALKIEPFPLLFPTPTSWRALASSAGGFAAVTEDHRLLFWKEGSMARELTARVPRGKVHDLSIGPGGEIHVVVGAVNTNWIPYLVCDPDTGGARRIELEAAEVPPRGVCHFPGVVCLVFNEYVDAFDTRSGERLDWLDLPRGVRWRRGRWFGGRPGWLLLSWDGASLRLEPVKEGPQGETLSAVPVGGSGPPIRRGSRAACVDAEGRLGFIALKGNLFAVAVRDGGREMYLERRDAVVAVKRSLRPFLPCPGLPGARYRLRVAEWGDGSRVFLDSRGLAHLVSSDRDIPQVSLLLCDRGPLAAWSSNGKGCGPPSLVGDLPSTSPSRIFELVVRFAQLLG
ncbi:MAG: hypothetical protein HY720_20180 [Planctomycetes bacterium]|nr:hypothetical protein [Planctomycetota bacterium]